MSRPPQEPETSELTSGILTSPADELLGHAVAATLAAQPSDRARLFEQLAREIESFMAARPSERPWTCTVFTGTDGSRIFRGGVGHSLVIDPDGRLWRARSHEDFETTWSFEDGGCQIASLTPIYPTMREYTRR